MAGSDPRKDGRRQNGRIVPHVAPGSSRVSRAAGSVGSQSIQSTRVESRTNTSGSRQAPRSAPRQQQGPRSKSATNSGSTKKGNSGTRSGTSTRGSSGTTPSHSSRDTQGLRRLLDWWEALEPNQQRRISGATFLVASLLLFGSITIFQHAVILGWFGGLLLTFLSWSAYPFTVGLVALSLARLVEGIRNHQLIRPAMILGLTCIWLLVLIESRLIIGGPGSVGVLAELIYTPLAGWPVAALHVLVLGLLLLSIILTFRITFGHVMLVYNGFMNLVGVPAQDEEPEGLDEIEDAARDHLYLGQPQQRTRRYNNYDAHEVETVEVESPVPARQSRAGGPRSRRPIQDEDILEDEQPQHFAREDEEDDRIEFEPSFSDEDDYDPRNDINLHKQEIGTVPRGSRAPKPIDLDEHAASVRGANQRSLPFDQAASDKLVIKQQNDLEPLAPNPRIAGGQTKSRQKALAQEKTLLTPIITSPWKLPDTNLLNTVEEIKLQKIGDDTSTLAKTIQETLRSFRVDAEVRQEDISIGPTIIRFGIRPTGKPELRQDPQTGQMVAVRDAENNLVYETRTRVSRIMALQNDLALVLEAKTIRMEAPVPGRPYVGVEIPNKNSRLVTLREVLESKEYRAAKAKSLLSIGLGKDVAGQVRLGDLARMPHLLIAGATGSGKSVCINTIIASILTQATPDDVRLLMVDPKMVELNMYNGIPHLLSPVVIEVEKVVPLLKNAISEMERRYRLFSQLNVRNLDGYRKLRLEKIAKGDISLNNLPAIVIIIDELADLMMAAPEEVESMICRLAQLARATGIHLVVATQRPSVDVITGLIKANIPTRISFMVSSAVDSRTIIDMGGAERLLGRGDMLYLPADAGRPERIQGAFLADEEALALVEYWKQQVIDHAIAVGDAAQPEELSRTEPGWEIKDEPNEDFELDDDLLEKAEEVVREYGKASISLLQRRLRVGYSRAARLIDLLEERGVIGQAESGGRAREVLDQDSDPNSRTVLDEVNAIMDEERQRDEFLRKQATGNRMAPPNPRPHARRRYADDEDDA